MSQHHRHRRPPPPSPHHVFSYNLVKNVTEKQTYSLMVGISQNDILFSYIIF